MIAGMLRSRSMPAIIFMPAALHLEERANLLPGLRQPPANLLAGNGCIQQSQDYPRHQPAAEEEARPLTFADVAGIPVLSRLFQALCRAGRLLELLDRKSVV